MEFEFKLLDLASNPAATIAKTLTAANVAMKNAKPAGDAMTAAMLKTAVAEAKAATETRRLTTELAGYVKQLHPAGEATKALTVEMGNMFNSFAGFRQNDAGGWTFNMAEGLKTIGGAAIDLIDKMLAIQGAADKMKKALVLNLGGEKPAKDILDWNAAVAEKSSGKYTEAQIAEQESPLVRQGIGGEGLKNIIAASHSVAERGGSVEAATSAFSNLRTNQSIGAGDAAGLGFVSVEDKRKLALALVKSVGGSKYQATHMPDAALANITERMRRKPQLAARAEDTILDELEKREIGGKFGSREVAGRGGAETTVARTRNRKEQALADVGGSATGKYIGDFVGDATEAAGSVLSGKTGAAFNRAAGEAANIKNLSPEEYGAKLKSVKKSPEYTAAPDAGAWDKIKASFGYASKPAGEAATVTLPTGEPARQFGVAVGEGVATKLLEAKATTDENGVPVATKKADDFIWRPGGAVEIDPSDTIVGAKRGGSLGVGTGGSASGGMSVSLTIAAGAIKIDGTGLDAHAISGEVMRRIREEGPMALLGSALEQFAAEQGA